MADSYPHLDDMYPGTAEMDDDDSILTADLEVSSEEMWRSFEVTREILRDIAHEHGVAGVVVCECDTCSQNNGRPS